MMPASTTRITWVKQRLNILRVMRETLNQRAGFFESQCSASHDVSIGTMRSIQIEEMQLLVELNVLEQAAARLKEEQ